MSEGSQAFFGDIYHRSAQPESLERPVEWSRLGSDSVTAALEC